MMARALLVVLVLGGSALWAQQTPSRPSASLQRVRGTVVVDDPAPTPIRRARVQVSAQGLSADPIYTTDSGEFEVLVPASAPYTITVSKAAFVVQNVARTRGDHSALQIRLARGAVMTGRVVDRFGDPVRTRVRVRGAGREWITDTDDVGEYRVGSLPAGHYEVAALPVGSSPSAPAAQVSPTSIEVRAGEEVALTHVDPLAAENVAAQTGMPISPSSPPQRRTATATGTIRGRVATVAGRPVGGAAVLAIWIGTTNLPRTTGEQMRVSMTDADGRYEFTDLVPGEYRVNAAKLAASLFAVDRDGAVTVRRDQLTEVDFRMGRPSVVEGTVVDEHGEPMEGITVQLWERRTSGGRAMLRPAFAMPSRRTDDRGRYRLFGAGAGAGYGAEPRDYYIVATDEPTEAASGTASSTGSTRVYYPGTAAIRDAAVVYVGAGRDATGIDITFAPRATGRVHGFAFDADGRPLTSPVLLRDSARSGFPTPASRTAMVGVDGAFAFLNVPPGDYVVHGIVRGNGRRSQFAMQYITVTDGDAPPVTIRTSRGTTLRGRIVAEGDTSRMTLDEFGLSVQLADWDWADDLYSETAHAFVEEDGTFEMTELHGPMRVTGTAPDGWWLKSVNIGVVDASEQPFVFGGAQRIESVTAVFADTAGEVTGRVVENGRPVSDYSVLMFPTDRNRWWASSGYVKLARPYPDGTFRKLMLPRGTISGSRSTSSTPAANGWTPKSWRRSRRPRAALRSPGGSSCASSGISSAVSPDCSRSDRSRS